MICLNCGKEIMDNSKFCVFCGAPAAPEAKLPDPEESIDEILNVDEIIGEKPENESVPDTNPTNSPAPAVNSIPANSYGYPVNAYGAPQVPHPQTISTGGFSAAPGNISRTVNLNVPMQNTAAPDTKPEKQGLERKYTIKHIIMCLVSAAVCAIAAGIFAGLYFSVV